MFEEKRSVKRPELERLDTAAGLLQVAGEEPRPHGIACGIRQVPGVKTGERIVLGNPPERPWIFVWRRKPWFPICFHVDVPFNDLG